RRGTRRRPLVARGRGAPAAADADADAPAAAAASERASLPRDEAPTVLQCRGVSVRFGGLQALGEVDLDVREGETVGLIGPNGAGKTTLMECVSGFQPVTEGAISYRGADLLHHAPGDRARLGIGRTLQNVRLFPYLTVVDNIRIALHRHERSNAASDAFKLPPAPADGRRIRAEAARVDELVEAHPAVIEAYLGTPTGQRKATAAIEEREVATSDEVLLDVEELDVFYDKVQVLYGVDFEVRRGERVALLGTNGAGKSTILRAASGLVPMAGGTIRWKGDDITRIPAERLVRLGLGHVPGGRGLFPGLSVAENLRMGGYIYDDEREVDAEVERVMGYFPWLAERAGQVAATLSGGEQQQLATARALMARPELLMIDELSLGLAPL